mmetsp:Transcript_90392/g.162982  ORF Transcript_90392/g.162982 Transcript_90392/m.162982 type:complete len:281 (-) Transcript_90392:109-951(-)
MSRLHWVLVCTFLCEAWLGTADEVNENDFMLLDANCSADEECGLSLRQLRAMPKSALNLLSPAPVSAPSAPPAQVTGPVPATAKVDAVTSSEKTPSPTRNDSLPGGWGEAAEEVDKSVPLGASIDALSGNYHSAAWWYDQSHGGRRRHYYAPSPPPPSPGGKVLTLYHQTGGQAGPLILANGFRPGSSGWCGGGIYFAASPKATETKAIGPQSHKGFMIQAKVNVGRVKYMPKHCDRSLNGAKLASWGFDSVRFNPGDGNEFIVYDSSRIISTVQIPWHR